MKAPFQCYKHSKTLPIILMLRGIMRMVPLCNHRGINSQFSSVHGLNWRPPPHAQFAPSRRRLKVRANSLVHWKHGRTVSAEHCVCRYGHTNTQRMWSLSRSTGRTIDQWPEEMHCTHVRRTIYRVYAHTKTFYSLKVHIKVPSNGRHVNPPPRDHAL